MENLNVNKYIYIYNIYNIYAYMYDMKKGEDA